jgi:hypothetical protein
MAVPADAQQSERRRKLDRGLDEALAQTFPASDPFSVAQVTGTEPPARPVDRKAPRFTRETAMVRGPGKKTARQGAAG